ncbi:ribosome biogenesis GTPase YlqF [Thiotrichales bacterium 19S9-12]|nr:ribosome biogenesis GTPase YlqF [Thiotrichales bacterium 19S9-11]MCF6811361.1 ribosome biogenesis GTPase YlqF [Thiotrichales bacterium 19S9-12]
MSQILHWFPGHMHKTRKELAKILPSIDLIIEVIDARLPLASSNPLIDELITHQKRLRILSKKDLANPKETEAWLKYFDHALTLNINQEKKLAQKIIQTARSLLPKRGTILKPIRAIIVGIPNVGKSSLINSLAQKKIAKVGNEPAVTRQIQNISLSREFFIRDTPGIMSPSPKDEASGFKLAISGAIRDTAMDYPSACYFLLEYLKTNYPGVLSKRYQLTSEAIEEEALLTIIAQHTGSIKNQANINLHQIAERIILDFRSGRLGRISLEHSDHIQTDIES